MREGDGKGGQNGGGKERKQDREGGNREEKSLELRPTGLLNAEPRSTCLCNVCSWV